MVEGFILDVFSPGQSITHKQEGMHRVTILREGTVGLNYQRKNATLNGLVLERLIVEDAVSASPVLLNVFLFNKAKRIRYGIVCETFCTVAQLEFDDLHRCLSSC